MKKYTIRQSLLAVGIAACLFPAYAQSQSMGNGPSGTSSGTTSHPSGSTVNPKGSTSTTVPHQSGSSATGESLPGSDPSGSTTRSSSPSMMQDSRSPMAPNSDTNTMTKDQGLTENDGSLNSRIRTSFNADPSFRESTQNVRLHSDNGVTTLNGTVASEKEKSDIEFKVQHMTGVSRVENNLQIAPRSTSSR